VREEDGGPTLRIHDETVRSVADATGVTPQKI